MWAGFIYFCYKQSSTLGSMDGFKAISRISVFYAEFHVYVQGSPKVALLPRSQGNRAPNRVRITCLTDFQTATRVGSANFFLLPSRMRSTSLDLLSGVADVRISWTTRLNVN